MLEWNTATQNEDNTLKYKVNEATLQPLHQNTNITTTKALDGNKYFLLLGKVKRISSFEDNNLNYLFIRK